MCATSHLHTFILFPFVVASLCGHHSTIDACYFRHELPLVLVCVCRPGTMVLCLKSKGVTASSVVLRRADARVQHPRKYGEELVDRKD